MTRRSALYPLGSIVPEIVAPTPLRHGFGGMEATVSAGPAPEPKEIVTEPSSQNSGGPEIDSVSSTSQGGTSGVGNNGSTGNDNPYKFRAITGAPSIEAIATPGKCMRGHSPSISGSINLGVFGVSCQRGAAPEPEMP